MEIILAGELLVQLRGIYNKLEEDYNRVAGELNLSCKDCSDNCCDSYFLHHTYAEWAYLWLGFSSLVSAEQKEILKKCRNYVAECDKAKKSGEHPQLMCPLNEKGLCMLYRYRMLVCRTHGVPAVLTRPDGQKLHFPGCFHCQNLVQRRYENMHPPYVERTPLLRKLVVLEDELLDNKRKLMPKVRLTIAEMLLKGPPVLAVPHCKR